MDIREIKAKTILTPTKLPDADYVINPYLGCRFGCTYCYASFMGRFNNKSINDWGNYIYAKINAPELLKTELTKLKDKGKSKKILFSSVTDPYQGLEAKYKLTRQCLVILADYGFAGTVAILTKSDLVLRDTDLFRKIRNIDIGMTVTSTSDSVSRYFEKFAPDVTSRLAALKKLNVNGFKTYVFIGPLLPHIIAEKNSLEVLFKTVAATGNKDIYVEHINLSKYILNRLEKEMPNLDKKILQQFYKSKDNSYRKELNKLVLDLVKKYNLKLRLGEAIYHQKLKKK